MQTTQAKRNKTLQTEHAVAIEEHLNHKQLRKTTCMINNLEIEVHKAMVVMDEETGRLINYKQIMQYPEYKKKWSTLSDN